MNNHFLKISVLIGILFCVAFEIHAQSTQDSVVIKKDSVYLSQFDGGNLLVVTLPPLEVLTEAALRNSPNLAALKQNIDIQRANVKSDSRDWLKYIGASANYGIANSANLSSTPDIFAPKGQMYNTSQSNYYSFGASLTIPIQVIVDWRNRNNLRKSTIKQAEYSVAQYEQDLKREILALYNEAYLSLALLKAKTEAVQIAVANTISIEMDFANGKVGTEGLAKAKQDQMRVMDDVENTKSRLRSSLMTLELLCGVNMYVKRK